MLYRPVILYEEAKEEEEEEEEQQPSDLSPVEEVPRHRPLGTTASPFGQPNPASPFGQPNSASPFGHKLRNGSALDHLAVVPSGSLTLVRLRPRRHGATEA